MPEAGTTDPSVRFLVRVAAVALILDRDMVSSPPATQLLIKFDLTGDARVEEAHLVVEPRLVDARRGQVGAAAADG
jgi:hypothetical protein